MRIGKPPVFIVAEISANHGQDFKRCVRLIKKAKSCGADAVKFQTYTPDTITIDMDNRYFRIKHPKWGTGTLYDLYKKAYTPWKWFKMLKKIAEELNLIFFSTSFDKTSVDFLEELNVPMHKISSFEITDLPLIEYAASTKKPLILSAGMATAAEIREAIRAARRKGAKEIILLKCVSSYPAKAEDMNLNTIPDMKKKFGVPVGVSDHTLGIGVSVASVALGATIIEKHFTLSRNIQTVDSFFSIEPGEFVSLVENVRIVEKALGKIKYGPLGEENKNRLFRRSLFAVKDIKRGEIFTAENIKSIRPAAGLMPKHLGTFLGRKAMRDIKIGTPLTWKMVK